MSFFLISFIIPYTNKRTEHHHFQMRFDFKEKTEASQTPARGWSPEAWPRNKKNRTGENGIHWWWTFLGSYIFWVLKGCEDDNFIFYWVRKNPKRLGNIWIHLHNWYFSINYIFPILLGPKKPSRHPENQFPACWNLKSVQMWSSEENRQWWIVHMLICFSST